MLNVVFGFDVSSTTIGYSALVLDSGKVVDVIYGCYKPSKKKSLGVIGLLNKTQVDIISIFKKIESDIKSKYSITKLDSIVGVEDFLLFFNKASTAKTITTLSIFNRIVCLSLYSLTSREPMLLHPVLVRGGLKKLLNLKDKVAKTDVPRVVGGVINNFGLSSWEFKWLRNKNGKLMNDNYDMTDAIAVAIVCADKAGLLKK